MRKSKREREIKERIEAYKEPEVKVYNNYETKYTTIGDRTTIKDFLKFFIIIVVITAIAGTANLIVNQEEKGYEKCLETCREKHFTGTKIGNDEASECISLRQGEESAYMCYPKGNIAEFDRTPCVKECGKTYTEKKR